MRTAFVQARRQELRTLVREALAKFPLALIEAQPVDVRRVAVAILELSAGRDLGDQLPPWLSGSDVPRLAIAPSGCESLVIDALRHGFRDYLRLPVEAADISAALTRLLPSGRDIPSRALQAIVGGSSSIRALREQVSLVAPARAHVLIEGETGTGKELVAQSIHELSRRHAGPFVAVNCGAIPDGLVESELFGYERGAFTGASASRAGLVKHSSGGTLFLDEVTELDPRAQVKLLRVLETREVQALGEDRALTLDLRVVAATNHDPLACVREGRLREDLYYRLNVVHLLVPPLRERSEDIPVLIGHFCDRFRREFSRRLGVFSEVDLRLLQQYDWPGNVRELRNVVEASFVHSSGWSDGLLELPPIISRVLHREAPPDERQRLVEALFVTHWNVSRAAQRLNCSRMTVYRKMTQFQLRRPNSSAGAIA
jgi:DNA-binding NtrC family response regulator